MTRLALKQAVTVLAKPQSAMRFRVLKGGVWLIGADVANRAVGLAKMVILARLLSAEDFGLMGLSILVLAWFEMFSQTGFSTALIRKEGDVEPYLNTFWTLQTLRGFVLAALIFAAAPLAGWMFHNSGIIPIVRAVSLVSILRGAANPAAVCLRRELRVEREVIWRMGGNLTGFLVAVPFAFRYRNVWTLVAAALAANVAELILSYAVVAHRPRFEIHWSRARELMRFGKWVFWANIASYLSQYADGWVVGRYLGSVSVGYYQVAQQFGMTPLSAISGHISAVALPAFSKLSDRSSLRSAFLRAIRFSSTITFPLGAFATVFAGIVVQFVLGMRWMPVCPLVRLLIVGGVVTALGGVSVAFLQAINRPNQSAHAAFLRFLSLAALVYPLMRSHGVVGVAFAAMLSSPIGVCYQYVQVVRALGWGWDFLLVFRHALIACTPALVAAAVISVWPAVWPTVIAGAICSCCSIILVVRLVASSIEPNV